MCGIKYSTVFTTLIIKPELLALSILQLLYSQFRSAFKIGNGKNIDWESPSVAEAGLGFGQNRRR
jgi:hypothetical protein